MALHSRDLDVRTTPSWWQHVWTIARFTLLEGARTRLAWTIALTLVTLAVASFLVERIAIADSARVRMVFLASTCRFAVVALLCQYIIASVMRELNDAAVQFALALPTPGSAIYIGKLAAFCVMSLVVATLTGAAAIGAADAQRIATWCALLFGELSLMAGVALFCALGTRQFLLATLLCGSVYLLARGIAGFEQLTASRLRPDDGAFAQVGSIAVQLLGSVLPDLSRFARAEWLADTAAGPSDLGAAAMQTAITLVLTAAAGIHDLKRRGM